MTYLYRKPKTARRVTKAPTPAQRRARAINFALFRLISARAATLSTSWRIADAPKDDLSFAQQAELHRAKEYINLAEMYLKDAVYALQSYNDRAKALAQKQADSEQAAKRATKQGEI